MADRRHDAGVPAVPDTDPLDERRVRDVPADARTRRLGRTDQRRDERTDDRHDEGHDERKRGFWREFPVLVVIALAIAILIKTFLIQAFYIPSESMEPTLERGDRVLVCRICTRVGDIHRGDVIVFADPSPAPGEGRGFLDGLVRWLAEGIGVAQPEDEDFIKRVVGIPGDVVEIKQGRLYVNGDAISEPYLDRALDTRSYGPEQIPEGMLFVLGDNRLISGDSRYPPPTGVGLVPEDRVIGEAFVVVWPLRRWGWI